MIRPDLNDYVYFAEVVAHGGFAAAGRALREPKSKLSRRIAALEARLGAAADRAIEPAFPRDRGRTELLRALPGHDAGGRAGGGARRGGAGRAARADPDELSVGPGGRWCRRWCAASSTATPRSGCNSSSRIARRSDRGADRRGAPRAAGARQRRLAHDAVARALAMDPGRQPAGGERSRCRHRRPRLLSHPRHERRRRGRSLGSSNARTGRRTRSTMSHG